MFKPSVPLVIFGAIVTTVAFDHVSMGQSDSATYTDPVNAGPDFPLQGEYLGVIQADGGRNWGAHVIALGKDEFRLVGYPGGLPGDGYRRSDEIKSANGKRVAGTIKFEGDDFVAELVVGQLKVSTKSGEGLGALMKVQRESTTLGQKPPEGATVLFDGSTADGFTSGKLTGDKLLAADCSSQAKFQDHFLHLEFRTPFKPDARGQARGNSGVYVQSRYEIQVLDSFGLSGENNECGGIYQLAKPLVNMCYPPLAWQTYDIEFKAARYDNDGKKTTNARITVRHNGVLIHDNVELRQGTPGKLPEGASAEPLYLQGHGNPVVYRNIWAISR